MEPTFHICSLFCWTHCSWCSSSGLLHTLRHKQILTSSEMSKLHHWAGCQLWWALGQCILATINETESASARQLVFMTICHAHGAATWSDSSLSVDQVELQVAMQSLSQLLSWIVTIKLSYDWDCFHAKLRLSLDGHLMVYPQAATSTKCSCKDNHVTT